MEKNQKVNCYYVKLYNAEPHIVVAHSLKEIVESYGDKIESINCVEKSVTAPKGIFK